MSSAKIRQDVIGSFGDHVASDARLLDECVNICQMYNISGEDLFYKWEALNFNNFNKRSEASIFSMDSIQALKARIQRDIAADQAKRQQARSSGSSMLARPRAVPFARPGTAMPAAGSSLSSGLATRSDRLLNTQVKVKENPSTIGLSRVAFKGPKNDEESRRKRAYRYMYEKVSERSEALDDRIDEFAELVREHYKIAELGDPSSSADNEITVVGRITHDSESTSTGSVKLNEATLTLESSRMMGSGARTPLRFDPQVKIRGGTAGTGGIGVFPGAIVALRGRNGGGGRFLVTEILAMPPLKPSPLSLGSASTPGDAPFSMCIASGPFTPDTDVKYGPWRSLIISLKSSRPAVLLLIGPFVDSAHPLIKVGDIDASPSQLFRQQFTDPLIDFLEASPGSIVLIVPSVRDLISDHAVFPQCELPTELAAYPRIQMLPNPSRFSLNGVSFAVTSVDSIFHLRKEEFFKRCTETESVAAAAGDSGTDAMVNLCRHMYQQRSFYPIFPVPLDLSHEVNLDMSHTDGLRLGEDGNDEAPDVLVVPSRLRHFAKAVYDGWAINPSFLTKGAYSTLTYSGPSASPLRERMSAEIIKLN